MGNLTAMALQVLILGAGIYVMLRFLGRTRGGGILRGLVVALAFGAIGLWSLTEIFGLEELGHLLQSVAGFVVVILVIVFQPELRRGIAQLGEHSLLGQRKRLETLSEVAQAAISMSKRKRGALIAFEREFNLDAYVDNAVAIDAEVTRLLLESIFHPGSALHDGAVVLRRDRVAAAACLLPLTENPAISRSTGTRHRAALGLTEETDAVTLVVSEETGSVSLCRAGRIEADVPPDHLETRLRGWLGDDHEPAASDAARGGEGPGRLIAFLRSLAFDDLGRKAAALGIALALLFLAHRAILVTREFTLQVVVPPPGSGGVARPSELAVQLPSADYRLLQPDPEQVFELVVSGSRAQVDALGPLLSGEVVVRPEMAGQVLELDPSDVFWSEGVWDGGLGLRAEWKGDPPLLSVEHHVRRSFALRPEHLSVDAAALDVRYRPDLSQPRFQPAEIVISGPEPDIARLDTPELLLRLAPVVLSAEDTAYRRERVGLAAELVERGFAVVEGDVQVTLAIVPALRSLGSIEKEIRLVTLEDADAAFPPSDAARWEIPEGSARARFGVRTVGVVRAGIEPDSPAWQERVAAVKAFLLDHLRVFADVTLIDPDDPRVAVHWILRDDWLVALSEAVGDVDPRARVELLLETEGEILLRPREAAESGAGETASGG